MVSKNYIFFRKSGDYKADRASKYRETCSPSTYCADHLCQIGQLKLERSIRLFSLHARSENAQLRVDADSENHAEARAVGDLATRNEERSRALVRMAL